MWWSDSLTLTTLIANLLLGAGRSLSRNSGIVFPGPSSRNPPLLEAKTASLPSEIPKEPTIEKCDGEYSVFFGPTNSCENLVDLKTSVCPPGQWLVLDPTTSEPVCQERHCSDQNELPIPGHAVLCLSKEHPFFPNGTAFCGGRQILAVDKYGFGHCECPIDRGLVFWEADGGCHPLFTRGPCGPGDIFVFDDLVGRVVCRVNPCADGEIYWLPHGRCYGYTPGSRMHEVCGGQDTLQVFVNLGKFSLECNNPITVPLYALGTFTQRRCQSGTMRVAADKSCTKTIDFGCPSGQQPDLFGGCKYIF
ncbi:unnamed protein product [Darwinula stevensoni]|uniref:DUF4789 domain-containing protein n=1 Tax=Darwinula stevensoni TaxID=69355 RepID=A0A7R8X6I7_9CRUS|nr:unnamed protein product [Darwinula stevensoni]CAG0888148.1 unnamed protein product [Darwinula stevensoni]